MAKLTLHGLIAELRGKLGNAVIRKIRGRYYMSRKPEPSKKPTAGQKAFRMRFRAASRYARHVQRDPALKAFYEPFARALDLRVRAVAISDWFNPPKVDAIDVRGYRGRAGNRILVRARAKVAVVSVHVRILNAERQPVEAGEATLQSGRWRYVATTNAPADAKLIIEATARNRAGHPHSLELPWPASA